MSAPAIRMEGVRRTFADSSGRTLFEVNIPSLTIPRGEPTWIRGPSGAGKTTALQLMAGLDRPDAGRVEVLGQALGALSEPGLALLMRRRAAFVPQSPTFIDHLPVWQNVSLRLVPDGVPAAERRRRAAAILTDLGLAGATDRLPGPLSGGERQRVAIARALVGGPEILFVDEPTANVDAATRQVILGAFEALVGAGLTLVAVSHDPTFESVASRSLTLVGGALEAG